MHMKCCCEKVETKLGRQNFILTAMVIVFKFNHLFTFFGGCRNYVVSHLKSSY